MLEKIDSPSDLKGLTYPELQQLAEDIREELINTVSSTGGHLASSLGAIEITIALHRVFNTPDDKIVWDVGHQSYAHKLLTGRRQQFNTLRQYKGLSGFPTLAESPHDAFGVGHASTSISSALGMALARDFDGKHNHIVAVIGDGSLTGGLAFEALNHAGHLGTRLIVILNDNGMAISNSTGALSNMLNRVRLDPRYEKATNELKKAIIRMPIGRWFLVRGKQAWNSLVKAITPGAFWEELGFIYLGPIDGHSISKIEEALYRARDYDKKPIIVHVITKKGHGYSPAESDATKFHGIPPANNGKSNGALTYSAAFGKTIARLMRENDRVIAISAAMIDGTGLTGVAKEFPGRVIDVGICEQHAVTLAAGLSSQGFIPVVAIYSTFLQRAYDQIIHDVCIQNLPVVFAIDRAGIVGDDGKTHQGAFDISYLQAVPGICIAAPKDEDELQHMLYTAVRAKRPIAIRYPRGSGYGVSLKQNFEEIPIGSWEVLKDGEDLLILATGATVYPSIAAAEKLGVEGIHCGVVNARFIKPLDTNLLHRLATRVERVITVEENAVKGGFGSAVLQELESSGLHKVRVKCLGIPDEFVEHGPQETFRSLFNLDADGISGEAKRAFPEIFVRPVIR